MKKNNYLSIIAILEFFISIIGLILQLSTVSQPIKDSVLLFVFGVMLLLAVVVLLVNLLKNRTCRRKKLISIGKQTIADTNHKAVFFGGDLSWTDDYYNEISKIRADNKAVEVYFPFDKLKDSVGEVHSAFINRIKKLKEIGAQVYYLDRDIGMRCIIIDPVNLPYNEDDFTVFFASCQRRSAENKERNIYILKKISSSKEREVCRMYLSTYLICQINRKEYNND